MLRTSFRPPSPQSQSGPVPLSGRLAPALVIALAAVTARAELSRVDSIRCDGGLVSERDSRVELMGKCGEPTFREERQEERVERFGGSPEPRASASVARDTQASYRRVEHERAERPRVEKRTVVTVERWTYDFGPSRFLQLITLEDGRVVRIERGAYGSERPAPSSAAGAVPRARCEPQVLRVGATATEVMAWCGSPASMDQKLEELSVRGGGVQSSVVQTWVYDFGPETFIRSLVFHDGLLRRVETGTYGFSR